MNGVNVSLKRYTGTSPQGVMKYAFEAETKALNAWYKGVDVYIDITKTGIFKDLWMDGERSEIEKIISILIMLKYLN